MDEIETVKPKKQSDTVKIVAEILIVVILAIILAGVINATVFVTTRVSGHSMDDTLYGGGDDSISQTTFFDKVFFGSPDDYGDKVLMVKNGKIESGDIIVFYSSFSGKKEQWIKRVIAVGGDTLKIDDGVVYVNGIGLTEDYAKGYTYGGMYSTTLKNGITIAEGELFVMGDNRTGSTDSRVIGTVKLDDVVGRVVLVVKKDTKKIVSVKNL